MTAKAFLATVPAQGVLPTPEGLRILIADDHYIVRRGLKRLIAEQFPAATFGEAANATELLALCTTATWQVILLDINMPGRSGLDVLREIKIHHPAGPVLIMSAAPEEEFAIQALKGGAAGYLDKRSIAEEIGPALTRVLAGKRYVSTVIAAKLADQLDGAEVCRPHETLSEREFQVLRLIATGKTLKEIAAELLLSEKTVGTYRARLADKLHLATNVELTRYALQHRLVD